MNVHTWIDLLEERWKGRDPQAIAELFTEEASYHQGPYGAPHVGRQAIAGHWTTTLSNQKDPIVWFGTPIASGDRAFVEWWCILHDPATGTPRTAAGCLALRFAEDGRCTSFHEYWHSAPDTAREPAEGWFA
ncbi:nuclear transport factor 2 family protein [Streptacidiphilus jiangxiensis]|uniref:SnoaL-like domain-containing protein n=1 Tax=Streptacidiphilus jiangxiensis TaxID=235985 RepID=A0A1H7I136_STRJI|nr:nuclear transport factor 2 family protein [Streptacidiphilus jiangxiensis]SEK56094.1 SnoaL-like domain-containing protein [Streptacidiphilus jiangxiensis]